MLSYRQETAGLEELCLVLLLFIHSIGLDAGTACVDMFKDIVVNKWTGELEEHEIIYEF